ncbi:unnamed protein product, partial [Didymodactylos carnosus]
SLLGSARAIRLDVPIKPIRDVPKTDISDIPTMGYFELLEFEKIQNETKLLSHEEKVWPIAPDGFVPNSVIRSMFKIKQIEPIEMKVFKLKWTPVQYPAKATTKYDDNEKMNRFAPINDISLLLNIFNKRKKNLNWQNDDDEEFVEFNDPEASFISISSDKQSNIQKKSKERQSGTSGIAGPKHDEYEVVDNIIDDDYDDEERYNFRWNEDDIPDLFKKMKQEPWWDPSVDQTLRSMVLYLIQVIKEKQLLSYELACNYLIDVFRTYGIEPTLVNEILSILLTNLATSENDNEEQNSRLCTIRTIGQFVIERKNIILALLELATKSEQDDIVANEAINAVKYITDVNDSNSIDLVLRNMDFVRSADEENFLLKSIVATLRRQEDEIQLIDNVQDADAEQETTNDDQSDLHPLLKKISQEKWYPKDLLPTIENVVTAILEKLPSTNKTQLKTLTKYLIELQRNIGFSNELTDRVVEGLVPLLTHSEPDHRLNIANTIGELGVETKTADIALLDAFVNDKRVQCGEALKKLSGIQSDTVLKDIADDISYLETLPSEGFSLQKYLSQKNPTVDAEDGQQEEQQNEIRDNDIIDETADKEQPNEFEQEQYPTEVLDTSETKSEDNVKILITTHEDEKVVQSLNESESFDKEIVKEEQYVNSVMKITHPVQRVDATSSTITSNTPSSMKSVKETIRIEISDKTKKVTSKDIRTEKKSIETLNDKKETAVSSTDEVDVSSAPIIKESRKNVDTNVVKHRGKLLPNNSEMWDYYKKRNQLESRKHEITNNTPVVEQNEKYIGEESDDDLYVDDENTNDRPRKKYLTIPQRKVYFERFPQIPHQQRATYTNSRQFGQDNSNNNDHPLLLEHDIVQDIIDQHTKQFGFYRPPHRSCLIPHKISLDGVLGEQSHMLVNNLHFPSARMRLSDLNRNRHLHDIEFIQLLSCLGINIDKALNMQNALTSAMKTDREHSKGSDFLLQGPAASPIVSSMVNISAPTGTSSDVTHAILLDKLLQSHGAPQSSQYIQQIYRSYPKFLPLLHSRIPQRIIPLIWNDPLIQKLASIMGNRQDDLLTDQNEAKKTRLPRHVLKFAYRDIDIDSNEAVNYLRDQQTPKTRRRRIYMHLMLVRHEYVKLQWRQLLKTNVTTNTDYRMSYRPIVSRLPHTTNDAQMCEPVQ